MLHRRVHLRDRADQLVETFSTWKEENDSRGVRQVTDPTRGGGRGPYRKSRPDLESCSTVHPNGQDVCVGPRRTLKFEVLSSLHSVRRDTEDGKNRVIEHNRP